MFIFKLFIVTSFKGVPRTPAKSIMDPLVTLVNGINLVGVVDLPLSLLQEVFRRYLSVKHTDQLLTHGKTVRVAKSVLYKIISRKDVIYNE